MNKVQKAILTGMILGDCYLQKTGSKNARIRLEHSDKQKDYLIWKASFFPEFFQGKPTGLPRFNPKFNKTYHSVRWQSNSSPEIGDYQKKFYLNHKKTIPDNFNLLLTDPVSLAIWYMDDGYLYKRDKIAYIYLPKYTNKEIKILLQTLRDNFGLNPVLKVKRGGNLVLIFSVVETKKLIEIVRPHIFEKMGYKLLDPVSTAI